MSSARPDFAACSNAWASLCRLNRHHREALLRLANNCPSPLDRYWVEPGLVMAEGGLSPDAWQCDVLESAEKRVLMLATRQAGKSSVAGALAILTATLTAPALVLLLSPSERQSGELAQKAFGYFDSLQSPRPAVRKRTELQLHLANGSRVIALPGKEATIRGYSGAALLLVDEAARVPDPLYYSVRPMLAVSGGRLVAMSTPFGKRGWFYEAWVSSQAWKRVKVTAQQCPRISPEFLQEERRSLGERWFRAEYECSFEDVVGAIFTEEQIQAMHNPNIPTDFEDA